MIRIIDYEIYSQHEWRAHEYEAWICAFDNWHPHVLFSGARIGVFPRPLLVHISSRPLIGSSVHLFRVQDRMIV